MHRYLTLAGCLCTLAAPAHADELMDTARGLFEPIPTETPSLPGIESTPERIELGKMLYFEPRLSESHAITCNSCHIVGMGGVDVQETSIGHRWQRGPRNAPTVLNAVFNTAQFWDGRAKDLEEQAGGPLVNPIEMGTSEQHAVEQLNAIPGYVEKFQKAFPEQADPITFTNVRDAIALFEATLITPNAPFDGYLRGDECAHEAERGAAGVRRQRLCRLPQRHQSRGRSVSALRRGRVAGRRVPAAGRQGSVRGHQVGERRVCVQGPELAQHRADAALLPHRPVMGPAAGGGGDG
jgi:cytochrome c peroxidase